MYAQYLENAAQKRAAVVPRPGLSGDGSGNSTETVVPAPATVKGKNENSNKKKGQKKDGNQKKVSTKHEQKQSVQQNPNASNTRARDGDQEHGVAVVSTSGNKNGDKQNKKRKQKKQKKPSTGVAANSPSGREDARMPEMAVNDVAGTYVSWETIESGDIDRFRVPETVHPVVLAALRNSVFPPNRLAAAGYILREGQQMLKMRRGPSSGIKRSYIAARTRNPTARPAIAIDCEMCLVSGGHDDITYLSAIDYLTGEILINNLISPSTRVLDYRTPKSGVSASLIESAREAGTLISGGFEEARERLLSFMDKNTVLVGYGLHHDLRLLGITHRKVVDGALWTAEAVMGKRGNAGRWIGLKQLCQEELGVEIQKQEKGGHSAVEDAMAAREIVLKWSLKPETRINWVQRKQAEL